MNESFFLLIYLLKNSEEIEILNARSEYLNSVKEILQLNHLPLLGVEDQFSNYFVLQLNMEIIGVIGLEIYGDSALIRSFAILPEFQKKGLGTILFQQILEYAQEKKIKNLYALTETAKNFFEKNGFGVVDRKFAPLEIQQSKEYTTICPNSAFFLKRAI